MSIEGTAQTEYASLSGKIQTFVVDKTLSISGACADAKATGDAIEKAITDGVVDAAVEAAMQALGEVAEEAARTAAVSVVEEEVTKAISSIGSLSVEEINAICQ